MIGEQPDLPRVFRGQWLRQREIPRSDNRQASESAKDRLAEQLAYTIYRYRQTMDQVKGDFFLHGHKLEYAVNNASDHHSYAKGLMRAVTLLLGDEYAQELQQEAERLADEFPGAQN